MNRQFDLPVPHPAVLFRPVSEGAVLLHGDEEVYFGLDEVGTHIWGLLPPRSNTLDEVVEALVQRYPDVERDILHRDLAELLGELKEAGLVADAG